MKLIKKMSCMFLALLMVITVLAVPTPAAAAERGGVPTKVRIYPGSYDNNAIEFNYVNSGDQIKNIKSSSNNLIAKQTYQREESEAHSDYSTSSNYAQIGLYAKKEGKYKVKFDIYSKDGTVKRSSHTVTVFAKSDAAVKSITLDGKDIWDANNSSAFTTKKSAKLSVKMSSGYTLKKITIRTYDKDGKSVEKVVKNNKKITLGQYGYAYSYNYQSEYSPEYYYGYWYKYLNAPTYIEITYKDKWTKEEDTVTYSVTRLSL